MQNIIEETGNKEKIRPNLEFSEQQRLQKEIPKILTSAFIVPKLLQIKF